MSSSEQINELAAALAKAQSEMSNAALNKTNPHFKSKYADLAAIRDATIPALTKNGLSIIQYTETIAAGMLLHTRLMHASGQWIEGNYPIAADIMKPQATGSALTYGRRYSWAQMCGIASEDDDDANAAQDAAMTNVAMQPGEQRMVYQRLVNTLRSTKNDDAVDDWKKRNALDVDTLDESYFAMLKQAVNDHRLSFKGAAITKPKEKLSSQALPPMPEDDLGAAS